MTKGRRREIVIAGCNSPSQFSNCDVRRACNTERRTSVSFRYCVVRVMNVVTSYLLRAMDPLRRAFLQATTVNLGRGRLLSAAAIIIRS